MVRARQRLFQINWATGGRDSQLQTKPTKLKAIKLLRLITFREASAGRLFVGSTPVILWDGAGMGKAEITEKKAAPPSRARDLNLSSDIVTAICNPLQSFVPSSPSAQLTLGSSRTTPIHRAGEGSKMKVRGLLRTRSLHWP